MSMVSPCEDLALTWHALLKSATMRSGIALPRTLVCLMFSAQRSAVYKTVSDKGLPLRLSWGGRAIKFTYTPNAHQKIDVQVSLV